MHKKYIFLALVLALIIVFFYTRLEAQKETKILLVGDMMFDRTIRKIIDSRGVGQILSCSKDALNKYDFVVGNLEGPITSNSSLNLNTAPGDLYNTTFTFATTTASYLKQYNVRAVSMANNHIFDFGKVGIEESRKALKKAGVDWFGDPLDKDKKSFIYHTDPLNLVGKSVAFVGFNQFLGVDSIENTVEEIKKRKFDGDIVVVFSHWGDEYVSANDFQKNTARGFIDAGADLVVGAHPHVIQESDVYKGKMIYYSLGNFIFDQWWNSDVKKGMGIELTIPSEKDKKITTDTVFFESSRSGAVCPISDLR